VTSEGAVCASCGQQLVPGAKFCMDCGAAQQPFCPGCGTGVQPAQKFCMECETALVAAPSPTSPPPLSPGGVRAERRLVSLLFADLVGFTTLSERRDPEEVREAREDDAERAASCEVAS
jgi:hypothetical protein